MTYIDLERWLLWVYFSGSQLDLGHNKIWGKFFFSGKSFIFLENSKRNIEILSPLLYVFHFSTGLLVSKYVRCDSFWSKLSYNMFYGPKIIKMALDQQWYPKSAWRHGHFSKNLFFILRVFFFFWSVAFVFPDILLLQMNNPTPRIRRRIWSAAQLRGPCLCLPGPSRGNQGDSLRCHYSASGQRGAGKLREGKPVRGPALTHGPLGVIMRTKREHQEIPAWGGSVDLTLTLLQEVGLASVGNGLIFRLCPLDLLFPQLLWAYLLSHSVWYKRVMKRKPERWEDCGTGVLAWACPECQIQGKIFTFLSPDTSSAKWI